MYSFNKTNACTSIHFLYENFRGCRFSDVLHMQHCPTKKESREMINGSAVASLC